MCLTTSGIGGAGPFPLLNEQHFAVIAWLQAFDFGGDLLRCPPGTLITANFTGVTARDAVVFCDPPEVFHHAPVVRPAPARSTISGARLYLLLRPRNGNSM